MNSITIITIVVVALLTVLIFVLDWIAYKSCLKAYRLEVSQGKHDKEIIQEYKSKKKLTKRGLLGLICSSVVLISLSSLFITGLVYKCRGENLSINNQIALVIKTGSMSDFYDDKTAESLNNDRSLQFDVGDICIFDKVNELNIGDVYVYKYKDNYITHRLINISEYGYEFKGDNNGISDYTYSGKLIQKDEILYHYTGKKVKGIGSFILYAQSYFGIWSLVGMTGVAVSSEIVNHNITKINKERSKKLGVNYEKK